MLLRPQQQELIDWVLSHLDGKPIAVAAPTSYGKSLVINNLADLLPGRTAIITLSNALVGQFIRDFTMPALIGRCNYLTNEEYECAKYKAKTSKKVIFNPASYIRYIMSEDAVLFDNVLLDEADSCLGLFRILAPTTIDWPEGLPITVPNISERLIMNSKEEYGKSFPYCQNKCWWELIEGVEKKSKKNRGEKTYSLKIHDVCLSKDFAKRFFAKTTIGLSGTMFPSFCKELFGTTDYHYKEVDSPIPIERRRIEAFTQEEGLSFPTDYEEMVALLDAVLKKYPQRPAIVHVTYRDVETVKAISTFLKGYSAKEDKMIALEDLAE
jgi:hypothetical protein